MNKRTLSVGIAAVAALCPSISWAAGPWYVSGRAGATFLNDSDNASDGFVLKSEHDTGFGVGGTVGWEAGNNIRLEGEIGYRENNLDNLLIEKGSSAAIPAGIQFIDPPMQFSDTLHGGSSVSTTFPVSSLEVSKGDVSALSFMFNAFYDIPLSTQLKPHIILAEVLG